MSEPVSGARLIGWVDLDQLEELWAGAPAEDDGALATILGAAYEKALEILPAEKLAALLAGTPPTSSQILAQVLLAQHLWARSKAGNGSGFGADGYMIQTYPLVMEARELLRPKPRPFGGLR